MNVVVVWYRYQVKYYTSAQKVCIIPTEDNSVLLYKQFFLCTYCYLTLRCLMSNKLYFVYLLYVHSFMYTCRPVTDTGCIISIV